MTEYVVMANNKPFMGIVRFDVSEPHGDIWAYTSNDDYPGAPKYVFARGTWTGIEKRADEEA